MAPAGTGIGQRESASFQSAVNYRSLRRSIAKKDLAEGLHGEKVAGAFVQISSGRQMGMAKKARPARGAAGVCTSTSRVWDADQERKRSWFAFYGNFTCVSLRHERR